MNSPADQQRLHDLGVPYDSDDDDKVSDQLLKAVATTDKGVKKLVEEKKILQEKLGFLCDGAIKLDKELIDMIWEPLIANGFIMKYPLAPILDHLKILVNDHKTITEDRDKYKGYFNEKDKECEDLREGRDALAKRVIEETKKNERVKRDFERIGEELEFEGDTTCEDILSLLGEMKEGVDFNWNNSPRPKEKCERCGKTEADFAGDFEGPALSTYAVNNKCWCPDCIADDCEDIVQKIIDK